MAWARGSWGHSVPVFDKSIPATGNHFGCFVRMPQATDAYCVMRLELAAREQTMYNVSNKCRNEGQREPDAFRASFMVRLACIKHSRFKHMMFHNYKLTYISPPFAIEDITSPQLAWQLSCTGSQRSESRLSLSFFSGLLSETAFWLCMHISTIFDINFSLAIQIRCYLSFILLFTSASAEICICFV